MRCALLRLTACVAAAVAMAVPAEVTAQRADSRNSLIARAQVWAPADTATKNLKLGPEAPDAFMPGETVTCDYLDKTLDGRSRKFACRAAPDDELKVKFGASNGEVQGEVAATRLLWALGFGADRMYPVRVICRGCPETYGEPAGREGERLIDPAVIERKFPALDMATEAKPGWSWLELDLIDEEAGGARLAHRDALRLLAVFLQHTDTKPEQQRLVCLDRSEDSPAAPCERPFMILNDVGLTFGRANLRNANPTGSVNLEGWADTPVWKGPTGCLGNLPRSFTGTLKDPVISEEGRRFLGGLLLQLSDAQLRDLFEVARVDLRPRSPERRPSSPGTVDEWVDAFKQKRADIVDRRCVEPWSAAAPVLFETGPILWIQSWSSPALTVVMNGISLAGYTGFYMAIAVVLAFGLRLRAGTALLLLLALTAVLTDATRAVVVLPRPDAVDSAIHTFGFYQPSVDRGNAYGFPSGHVAAATAFFFGLLWLFRWSRAWTALAIWVPLMALSRMYLGRHFLADVLGGIAVAVIAAAIALVGLNLARLSDRSRARRIARGSLLAAGGVGVMALLLGIPSTNEAGRLLGVAAGMLLLVHMAHVEDEPAALGVRVGRVGLAAVLCAASWWGVWLMLAMLDAADTPAAALIRNAAAGAVLIAGPLSIERLAGWWKGQWFGGTGLRVRPRKV